MPTEAPEWFTARFERLQKPTDLVCIIINLFNALPRLTFLPMKQILKFGGGWSNLMIRNLSRSPRFLF